MCWNGLNTLSLNFKLIKVICETRSSSINTAYIGVYRATLQYGGARFSIQMCVFLVTLLNWFEAGRIFRRDMWNFEV